ncbi:MAG TPA: YqaJ viral recombinase family protein [Sphaerochaeta sp.]|nr:YqaJ viral recombinase family protein [Sphaerochaeta sp.]
MIRKIPFTDRTDWLSIRRNAIGGSDAAAILGLSRYSSPLSVYADKMNLVPEKEDNEPMRQGRDLEEYVAQRFTEKTGLKVRKENHILVNDDTPFMHANIDRRIVGCLHGLECKTTSVYNDTDFEGGDIPAEYYTQCQHYMAVTGWDVWYLAVLVLNRAFYDFRIERNEEDIKALIDMEGSFWRDHVIAQVPPEPLEQDDYTLSALYPSDNGGFVPLNSASAILKELDQKKQLKKAVEAEVSTLENYIKQMLGDASEGSDDSYKVTWKNRTSTRFDSKRFKVEHAKLYKRYTNETTSRTFLLAPIKKAKEAIK